MKPLSATTATVALLLSTLQAPFAHMHRRDPDHRHAAAMPHAHFPGSSDQRLSLHGPDDVDDVEPVEWVLLSQDFAQPFVAETGEPLAVLAPPAHHEFLRAPVPRAHDPPGLISSPPRAPPA